MNAQPHVRIAVLVAVWFTFTILAAFVAVATVSGALHSSKDVAFTVIIGSVAGLVFAPVVAAFCKSRPHTGLLPPITLGFILAIVFGMLFHLWVGAITNS